MTMIEGLSEQPGQVYSIASRCVCDKCGIDPQVLSVKGEDPYTITVECHGQKDTKTVTRRGLSHIQRFFAQEE
jgi:predicted nucleic acid-binding Zn ribbon protein